MKMNEIINEADMENILSPEDDTYDTIEMDDTRKPKITLKIVNKLKKIRSVKRLGDARRNDLLDAIYGQVESE